MATDTEHEHDNPAAHADGAHVAHGAHWSDLKYVKLAILLAAVTAAEVVLSYMKDDVGAVFLPVLLILMAFKFMAVVLFFMHLRFDNRLFSLLFYMGLGLAIGVYMVALFTFRFFDA